MKLLRASDHVDAYTVFIKQEYVTLKVKYVYAQERIGKLVSFTTTNVSNNVLWFVLDYRKKFEFCRCSDVISQKKWLPQKSLVLVWREAKTPYLWQNREVF